MVLLGALVLRPLPAEVAERIAAAERELSVDEGMVAVARRFATGALGLAAADFERNGYTADWRPADAQALHTSIDLAKAWDVAVADPELAARWDALAELPTGTLGRRVWELYRARGFEVPGRPGSAPPLLAQHDWVHVLADYGTVVDNELEVFAFIARANDDMRAFSLLAMVVSLFETGYLPSGAGLFESSPGHLSTGEEMAVRVADAMYRRTSRPAGSRRCRCRRPRRGSGPVPFAAVAIVVTDGAEPSEVTPASVHRVTAGPGGVVDLRLVRIDYDIGAVQSFPLGSGHLASIPVNAR